MSDKKPRVLIVDDEADFAGDIAMLLSDSFRCKVVVDASSAMREIQEKSYALVLVDIDLQADETGIDLLREMKNFDSDLPVVMLTKSRELSDIVESMRAGAYNYIVKGTDSLVHEIVHVGRLAIDDSRMRRKVAWLQRDEEEKDALAAIVGSSPQITKIKKQIDEVAPLDCSVLITGDSGTGKELVARALHALSWRAATGNFVPVNCGALDETLLKSEVFGHEKGAFTGADRQRIGKFEYAKKGTLFLDEIGDMPSEAQAMLLRALEDKVIYRLGSNEEIRPDARVVSATNHDLAKQIESGAFRRDLQFRLNQYRIHVPLLKERKGDIPDIARHLLGEITKEFGRGKTGISQGALDSLCDRDWEENNVRELRHAIAGAVIRCRGDTVQVKDFVCDDPGSQEALLAHEVAKDLAAEQFQRHYFTRLLRITHGNVAAVARMAGMPRPSVSRILKKLGIDPSDFKE